MDNTLKQVGELLLGAIPTVVILLSLWAIYNAVVRKPLVRVLEQRRERTEGAVLKARADVSAAEAKTQDYEQRLREARLTIFKAQEARRQAAQQARSPRRLRKPAHGRSSRSRRLAPPSIRTWLRRAPGCRAKSRDWPPRLFAPF